jgi:uncharacterized membrane protein
LQDARVPPHESAAAPPSASPPVPRALLARRDPFRGPPLVAIVRVVFTLAGALPWALPWARAKLPLGPLGWLADAAFLLVCHRRPERTLVFADVAMPVCSRCGGIFAGLALGALVAWPTLSLRAARAGLALGGVAMLVDVVTQDLGLHPVWHAARIGTGAVFGYAFACALVSVVRREQGLVR